MAFQRFLAITILTALGISAETDYRFAFPQSEFLLGVDVKWLMKSPFGETLRKEIKGNLGELKPLEALLEQIDSIHLSVVSKGGGKSSDLLMMVDGRFDVATLADLGKKNGFRVEQWGKTQVLLPKRVRPVPSKKVQFQPAQFKLDVEKSKPGFALVDARHIVIGEEAPLRVALERLETGLTPQANPLFERARDLEAANDVWLIGNTAPLNLNAAAPAGKKADPMAQLASQVRNFSLGIAVRRNVALDMQLQATSPKVAAQLLDLAKAGVAMARMNATEGEAFPVDLDKALQMTSAGNVVRASLTLEQNDIDRIMASSMVPSGMRGKSAVVANAAPAAVAAVAPAAAPVIAKPAEPARKTIFIYGLPGGPKEVPVQ